MKSLKMLAAFAMTTMLIACNQNSTPANPAPAAAPAPAAPQAPATPPADQPPPPPGR